MTIQEKITYSELIYTTRIKWALKRYSCGIHYFTSEPLDDLCFVISSLVASKGVEGYPKNSLGEILGFSMIQKGEGGSNVSYRDRDEIKLFEDLIELVVSEHLIRERQDENGERFYITRLGQICLERGEKIHFFSSRQNLYEHMSLKSSVEEDLDMFPFYDDMGVFSVPTEGEPIWPEDTEVESIIFGGNESLIDRLHLQSKDYLNIYEVVPSKYYEIDSVSVDVRLYKFNDEYIPVIMNGDAIAIIASTYLSKEENSLLKENIILECLFKKLWEDKDSVLNYQNLKPFDELVNYEELTKDTRVVWEDEELWNMIVCNSDSACWENITRNCSIIVLYNHIHDHIDDIHWETFSERVDDKFLMDHFLEYPWDLEVISRDLMRKEETIERLILLRKDTYENWDWEELETRLSGTFVFENIDIVKVDLSKYTNYTDDCKTAILKNPDKLWDWQKIEKGFPLDFFYNNMMKIQQYMPFEIFFDRVFTNPEWSRKFAISEDFRNAIKENINKGGKLTSVNLNGENYLWETETLDSLEEIGLVFWESTEYVDGFECNPYFHWTDSAFNSYKKHIVSERGYEVVSENIQSLNSLKDTSFSWNYHALSRNKNILKDKRFFENKNIDWVEAINALDTTSIIEDIVDIDSKLSDDENAWDAFSRKANIKFITSNYKFPWNWSVLTERLFSEGKLKLENIGHADYVGRWDWRYFSLHLPKEFIEDNLSKYIDYWDWNEIFPMLLNSSKKTSLEEVQRWASMLSLISTRKRRKEAWAAFTRQYSFKQLKELIQNTADKKGFWWDIDYFCSHKDFYVFEDLNDCRDFVSWEALSSSSFVDEKFKYNPDCGITESAWKDDVKKMINDTQNHWNFNSLSKFKSLYAEKWFLSAHKDKLDWNFITKESPIFSDTKDKQDLNALLVLYQDYISFSDLSLRKDIDTEFVMKLYPKQTYDYNSMIKNGTYKVKLDDVLKNQDYDWNWELLSVEESFIPSAHFLETHVDYPLNWFVLSRRNLPGAWSSDKLIKKIASIDSISSSVDWYSISSMPQFPITSDVIDIVPLDKLNWTVLSQRKSVLLFLERLSDYVNWGYVSRIAALDVRNLDLLDKHKDKFDWSIICNRKEFKFSVEIINRFSEYIDWSLASKSIDIEFTEELVNTYKERWNWPALTSNKAYYNRVRVQIEKGPSADNIITFLKSFPRDVKPKAYHFTHMSNAVSIIQMMKLQCRNEADGCFDNSAGNLVENRKDAHDYARFYFVPQSPTQFYNECLGYDSTMKSKYYKSAYSLGLPKCPMPVFFVFDIEEVLMSIPDKCYYSTGNMQKGSSKIYKVVDTPDRLRASGIYKSWGKTYHNDRQQEFLVLKELDLSVVKNISIFCYDEYQRNLLKEYVKESPLVSRIAISTYQSGDLFIRKNRTLEFEDIDETLSIRTDYKDDFEFRIESPDNCKIEIINKEDIKSQRANSIYLKNKIEIKKDIPFRVYFEVKTPKERQYLIYSNQ